MNYNFVELWQYVVLDNYNLSNTLAPQSDNAFMKKYDKYSKMKDADITMVKYVQHANCIIYLAPDLTEGKSVASGFYILGTPTIFPHNCIRRICQKNK